LRRCRLGALTTFAGLGLVVAIPALGPLLAAIRGTPAGAGTSVIAAALAARSLAARTLAALGLIPIAAVATVALGGFCRKRSER
jgi:hypothetical protein